MILRRLQFNGLTTVASSGSAGDNVESATEG